MAKKVYLKKKPKDKDLLTEAEYLQFIAKPENRYSVYTICGLDGYLPPGVEMTEKVRVALLKTQDVKAMYPKAFSPARRRHQKH